MEIIHPEPYKLRGGNVIRVGRTDRAKPMYDKTFKNYHNVNVSSAGITIYLYIACVITEKIDPYIIWKC